MRSELTLLPGVARLLDEAGGRGVPCAIASSSGADWVQPFLAELAIEHRFAAVSTWDGPHLGFGPKPEPDVYRVVCERLGVEPTDCVAFEDSPHGITSAKAAGLACVCVPNRLTVGLALSHADVVVDSLLDVAWHDLERLVAARARRVTGVAPRIRLTVWSDFLCPWCYVGAFRMADLEARYGDGIDVQWRSHVLRPTPKERPLDRFREYTTLWSAPAGPGAYEPRCEFRTWGDERPPTHSIPAAVAAKVFTELAHEPDQPERFRFALFRAYFTEHRTISEVDVLAAIAAECGIDAETFRGAMQPRGAELYERVVAEHNEGLELGAHAAPTVLINDTLPIPGAQDLDTYVRILDRMLARARA